MNLVCVEDSRETVLMGEQRKTSFSGKHGSNTEALKVCPWCGELQVPEQLQEEREKALSKETSIQMKPSQSGLPSCCMAHELRTIFTF